MPDFFLISSESKKKKCTRMPAHMSVHIIRYNVSSDY